MSSDSELPGIVIPDVFAQTQHRVYTICTVIIWRKKSFGGAINGTVIRRRFRFRPNLSILLDTIDIKNANGGVGSYPTSDTNVMSAVS